MSAFFLSSGVSPDVSGDDEDDEEGGEFPVCVNQSIKQHRLCLLFRKRIVVSGAVHTTPAKFENGTISSQFRFVFEENSNSNDYRGVVGF